MSTVSASASPSPASRFTPEHHRLLDESAVDLRVAEEAGVYSVTDLSGLPQEFSYLGAAAIPALVFPWTSADGTVVLQFRSDHPVPDADGRPMKYLFPSGAAIPVNVHPAMKDRVAEGRATLVLVEGTKQYLAAVTALASDPGYAVVGMSGCWGWSHGGKPSPSLRAIPWKGREVVLVLDADRATNPDVYDAATRLADVLKTMFGATGVKFASLPAGGTNGLDDVLAGLSEADRPAVLRRILDGSNGKAGPRPKRAQGPWMDAGGPRVEDIVEDIRAKHEVAVTAGGAVLVYRDGYFQHLSEFLSGEVTVRLGNSFRSSHTGDVEKFMRARLTSAGRMIPDSRTSGLLNMTNGMLDPLTSKLVPHDPKYLSTVRWPCASDPTAKAPTYEAWMAAQVGDQTDDLEEVVATMLDQINPPSKALLLYGPSRSGKSTFLRLVKEIAGADNTSAVTLHQLATNQFAPADIDGKVLNVVADLSSGHVEDLSVFKTVTGGDAIRAERKFKQPYTFVNRALFAFSANRVPSVGEDSRAYEERMKPFLFGRTFAGEEDPAIEEKMMEELPGILVRLVEALQRLRKRGKHLPTRPDVAREFAQNSDRVKLFLAEGTTPDVAGTSRPLLHRIYKEWSEDSGTKALSNQRFYDRLRSAGVGERRTGDRGFYFEVRILGPGEDPPAPGDHPDSGEGPVGDSCDSSPSLLLDMDSLSTCDESVLKYLETDTTVTRPQQATLAMRTGDPKAVFTHPRGDRYVHLASVGGSVTSDMGEVLRALEEADEILGHGLLTGDLIALARHHGADYRALAAKTRDVVVLARLADPPLSGDGHAGRAYELPALAEKYLGIGPTAGLTPEGALRRDVDVIRRLGDQFPMTDYGQREHRLTAIAGQIRLTGFRVDTTELAAQLRQREQRREQMMRDLARYGISARTRDGRLVTGPLGTNAGRAALEEAFFGLGVALPRKASGVIDLGSDSMGEIIRREGEASEARRLASLVREFHGQRHILQQVSDNVVEGRVHAHIDASQATGRWSVTDPGLTTLGKRNGLHGERAIFLPDPGDVILVADLSQIDPRAVAAHCQDPAYMDLFAEGRDFHTEVAIAVLGDASNRDLAKALNSAANYGVGATKLSEMVGVSVKVAQNFLAGMDTSFPIWAQWKRDVVEEAAAGHLLDNGFGRLLRVDPSRAFTGGPAAIGQSCARDLFMEGLLRMDDAGLTQYLRCMVHDEVVLSVPADAYDEIGRLVLKCLTFDWAPPHGSRAIRVTAELGKRPGVNWADAYRA